MASNNKKTIIIGVISILILIAIIGGFFIYVHTTSEHPQKEETLIPTPTTTLTPTPSATYTTGSNATPTEFATGSEPLKIHFIDIGQGDAILLSYDGKYAMVDAGKSLKSEDESQVYLDKHLDHIKSLDWLLTTHPHYDHIGLARHAMTKAKTGMYYDNGDETDTATYDKLMNFITQENIPYTVLSTGDSINGWDGVNISVVSSDATNGKDLDDDSIVLLVEHDGTKVALTGDISSDVESEISEKLGKIDILKVPHHGSRYSSSSQFLNTIKPDVSIICVGENTYGHPHTEALDRLNQLSTIYRTDEFGCVEVIIDRNGYNIQHCEWE